MVIAARLNTVDWLNAAIASPRNQPRWARPLLGAMALMMIAAVVIVVFAVRRLTYPLTQLVSAAKTPYTCRPVNLKCALRNLVANAVAYGGLRAVICLPRVRAA